MQNVSDTAVVTMSEVLALVSSTSAALRQLPALTHQLGSEQLADVVGDLGDLAALATAGQVVATADAETRGVVEASQFGSTRAWVADADFHLQMGGAATIAKSATILRRPDLAPLADSIRTADISPQVAVTVQTEFDKISPRIREELRDVVLDRMTETGSTRGSKYVRRMHEHLLDRYGKDGELQEEQDATRRYISLSPGRQDAGVWHYDLTLDPEGRAVLEAAIGPLSAPRPEADGTHDTRTPARRRGEALIAVCRRSAAAADGLPASPKAALCITIDYDDLAGRLRAGTVTGSLDAGALLGPDTIRKIACDAGIIPMVMGADGAVLDLGRDERLFTRSQLRVLWARDQHCTFDDCDAPVHWTDAHHLIHWADGGRTDVNNGASLCGPHHTIVHRDKLAGAVIDGKVVWDRRPGSYQPPSPHRGKAAMRL